MRYYPLILFFTLFLAPFSGCGQEKVKGKIFSAKDSTALARVSVYFDGTSLGTTTNEQGAFTITHYNGSVAPLVIS